MAYDMSALAVVQGFVLGVTICATLGPQSLFVLRQGLDGRSPMTVAAICTVADFALLAVAFAGANVAFSLVPDLAHFALWGGAAFCIAYALAVLAAALRSRSGSGDAPGPAKPRMGVIAAALALSLLNPQSYLEMVLVVGGVALGFPPADRMTFILGVAAVSPLWFFGLAMSGRRISGWFSGHAGRVFDLACASVMLALGTLMICDALFAA